MAADPKDWGFAQVWNKSLMRSDSRPAKVRDNLWASELGKSPVDLYLRMTGVEPTNPPNARSMRKFEAGNVFEWIVGLILKRAGILKDNQKWTSYQYPGLLKVTGKLDFIAGGTPDFGKAVRELEELGLPDVFVRAAEAMKTYFAATYPGGLVEKPLEIKSVSAFMFDALERRKKGSKMHRLQLFHYLKSEGFTHGNLVYICRDDLRMMEVSVGPETEEEYYGFIERMTALYRAGVRPDPEQPIVFDDDTGRFTTNFNVAYSGYLTLVYGLKDQAEFDAKYKGTVGRWNRVLNRVKNGDKMTPKNLEVLVEITEAGFDVPAITAKFEATGTSEEED